MVSKIDLAKLADFMIEEVDCLPEYEDDAFSVDYNGERLYVERYTSHFYIEDRWGTVYELPRP